MTNRTIVHQASNYRIVSIYNRRYLVQRYNSLNGRWVTEKICWNDGEAKSYLHKIGRL